MLFQNKIGFRYCASGWFYYRSILRMYGPTNVKFVDNLFYEIQGYISHVH